LRLAKPNEAEKAVQVAVNAYASDPVWLPMMPSITSRMTSRVVQAFQSSDSGFICAVHDDQVIAVSGLAENHWTGQNFLTGICVLPEHQRRGLGLCMLAASLSWLRDRDLEVAQVFTEEGSIADLKIYPNFGSERVRGVEYLDPPKVGH
jgi:ribosomal protein S18 acetylase RimI-like enzyme